MHDEAARTSPAGSDLTAASDEALRQAYHVANDLGTRLIVGHVVPNLDTWSSATRRVPADPEELCARTLDVTRRTAVQGLHATAAHAPPHGLLHRLRRLVEGDFQRRMSPPDDDAW